MKRLDEPYQYILVFPEIGESLLFKSRNYMVSVLIALNPSYMYLIIYVSNSDDSLKLLKSDLLDQSWLDDIR